MSQTQSIRGTFLKYKADRRPVTIVIAMFAVHVALLVYASPTVCLIALAPLTVVSMFVGAVNHHHQHLNVFRAAWLNRIYDLVLALQTGQWRRRETTQAAVRTDK